MLALAHVGQVQPGVFGLDHSGHRPSQAELQRPREQDPMRPSCGEGAPHWDSQCPAAPSCREAKAHPRPSQTLRLGSRQG